MRRSFQYSKALAEGDTAIAMGASPWIGNKNRKLAPAGRRHALGLVSPPCGGSILFQPIDHGLAPMAIHVSSPAGILG